MNPFPRNSFPLFSPSCYKYSNTVHLLRALLFTTGVCAYQSTGNLGDRGCCSGMHIMVYKSAKREKAQQQIKNVVCKWNLCAVRPTLMGTKNLYENGPNPFCFLFFFNLRPTLMHTKNLYENGPNPFFSGFFNLIGIREWSRFVWPNPFELFVTGLRTDLVP